jgi:hypothetical protein
MFKPLSGLINQDKYLPLRYMGGLTLEFELISDPTECLISQPYTFAAVAAAGIVPAEPAAVVLQTTDISTSWYISDVQIKCDVIQLDSGLNDEYVKYLLSGKALAINYNTYVSQFQTVSGQENSINVTRSLSRLKSIFISHMGPVLAPASYVYKYPNTFYHPMSNTNNTTGLNLYDSSQELEWQIQIGSRLFPEYSCRSISESYYQLLKCVGTLDSSYMGIDISAENYRNLKYVIGLDLEKVLQAGFTGINTKAGDLLTVKTKSRSTVSNATMMHIILHADMILNISDNGVAVFD